MGPIYIFLGAAIGFVAGMFLVNFQLKRRRESVELQGSGNALRRLPVRQRT